MARSSQQEKDNVEDDEGVVLFEENDFEFEEGEHEMDEDGLNSDTDSYPNYSNMFSTAMTHPLVGKTGVREGEGVGVPGAGVQGKENMG